MKKIILSIIILILTSSGLSTHIDHYANFNSMEYELYRNNKLIGYHNYDFTRNGDELVVNSDVEFKIKKFGVELYNYKAKSSEIYKNSKFFGFSSTDH